MAKSKGPSGWTKAPAANDRQSPNSKKGAAKQAKQPAVKKIPKKDELATALAALLNRTK